MAEEPSVSSRKARVFWARQVRTQPRTTRGGEVDVSLDADNSAAAARIFRIVCRGAKSGAREAAAGISRL